MTAFTELFARRAVLSFDTEDKEEEETIIVTSKVSSTIDGPSVPTLSDEVLIQDPPNQYNKVVHEWHIKIDL